MGLPRIECNRQRMKIDAILRAAQILRAQPTFAMPLGELHSRMLAELGRDAGSYAEFCALLKKRPASFIIIDSPRLADADSAWPRQVRERYRSALAETDLGVFARVALAELPGASVEDVLAMAGRTINGLWQATSDDPILRAALARASYQLDELSAQLADAAAAHPTTRPRYPHP